MNTASIFTPIITGNMIYNNNHKSKLQEIENNNDIFEMKLENSNFSEEEKKLILLSRTAGYSENFLVKQFNLN